MFITFHGAANEVTGSCYLIETGDARVVVDCGMFQGSKHLERLNFIPAKLQAQSIQAVVLTHGHLDHCGRLPLLVKEGFSGHIYGTEGTLDIARLILSDAAKIQEDDTARENRKRARAGQKAIKPLFSLREAEKVFKQFAPIKYNTWLSVAPGINVELVEAGHILGSASVVMVVGQNGGRRRLIFSGDLGQWNSPLNRDPNTNEPVDIVVMEGTYGGRQHPEYKNSISEFEQTVIAAVKKRGKILIPTFAVGRTQQLLFQLYEMFRKGLVEEFPIYLDSPMAIAATQIYSSHTEMLDEEVRDFFSNENIRHYLPSLRMCTTAQESQALNAISGPCLIMAGAGMCDAGRIMHHLRHNLNLDSTVLIIVGYQAKDSLGRRLLDGVNPVKIMGDTVYVRAKISNIEGFSAHADQDDLLRWLSTMTSHNPRVILTHGEAHQLSELSHEIEKQFNISCETPSIGSTLEF